MRRFVAHKRSWIIFLGQFGFRILLTLLCGPHDYRFSDQPYIGSLANSVIVWVEKLTVFLELIVNSVLHGVLQKKIVGNGSTSTPDMKPQAMLNQLQASQS